MLSSLYNKSSLNSPKMKKSSLNSPKMKKSSLNSPKMMCISLKLLTASAEGAS